MKLPIQVQFHGMQASAVLESKAREHCAKLDTFAPDIMACRVVIDLEQKHQRQGRPVGVRIDLSLPGHELVSSHVVSEDAHVALGDAFDNVERQLREVVRQRRGRERAAGLDKHGIGGVA